MSNNLKLQVILKAADKITKPFKNMVGQAGKLNKAINENKESLNKLNKSQAKLNKFKDLKKGARTTATELTNTQKKAADLAQGFKKGVRPTQKLTREFERAKRKINKLKAQQILEKQELQRLGTELRETGVRTGRFTDSQNKLKNKIKSVNESLNNQSGKLKKLTTNQQAYQRAQRKFRRGMQTQANTGFVGAASTVVGQKAFRGLANVFAPGIASEAQMSRVAAIARISTDSEEFEKLNQQAASLGRSTPFTKAQAAQGQAFLSMTGFSPEQTLSAMPHMLNLAISGGKGDGPLDLGGVSDIVSNIMTTFKLTDAEHVTDVLAATVTRSNVDLEMLGETIKYAGLDANVGKISLEETAAMAGILGNAGVQSSNAGTAQRGIYNRLAAPPKEARESLAQLGVTARDAEGNLRNVPQILSEISAAMEGMGSADRMEIFKNIAGLRFGGKLAALVDKTGTNAMREFIKTITNSQGENQAMAKKISDNAKGDLVRMSSAWDGLRESITESNTSLRESIQWITKKINAVTEWAKAHPKITNAVLLTVAAISIFATVMGGLVLTIASVIGPSVALMVAFRYLGISGFGPVAMIKKLAGALKWIFLLMRANPIGLLVTALVVGATLIYKNWDWLKTKFSAIWEKIQEISGKGVDYFKSIPGKFMDVGKQIVQGLVNGILSGPKLLEDAAKKVSGVLIGKFKGLLGIHSPSRVFMGFGGNITQGLNIGMLKEQTKSASLAKRLATAGAIAAATGGVSVATASPTLSASGGNISAPVSQNITIHVQAAPGMDEAALARLVAQKLEEINRQNAARERSRLFDNY